jgi:hypothetical protein
MLHTYLKTFTNWLIRKPAHKLVYRKTHLNTKPLEGRESLRNSAIT